MAKIANIRAWWDAKRAARQLPGSIQFAEALESLRSIALAAALLWFMAMLTLDDVAALPVPAYFLGVAGAIIILAFIPLIIARVIAARNSGKPPQPFRAQRLRTRRIGRLMLAATMLAGAVWMMFFSAGVPPWAS